jgi:predicted  nucleic acid-binding Zn-ribbon protein
MAKSKKPRGNPAKSTEPTVSQQRQAYYEARARRSSLEELGVALEGEAPRPAADKKAALEALDSFDRLMVLYGICRWTALSGSPPEPEDWQDDKDWPQPDAVDALFGGWDDALAEAGVLDSGISALLDRVAKAHQELGKRAEDLERQARKLEDEAKRVPELERQVESHKARRDEADLRAREVEGERERLIAERDRAEARAVEMERRVAELESAASAAAPPPPDSEAIARELAAAREEILRLHDELDAARAESERDRKAIAELSALARRPDEAPAAEAVEEDEPQTVLEAVERAAAEAKHLRFAPRAFETAEDSPFRRPGLILDTLRRLDELAGRYAEGDMGKSLSQAATDVGITQWKSGVSELARTRWRDEYLVTIDGQEVELGPHIGLGSGSGAGFVARIYLHVADGGDGLPRGITVGVVGRHLPDTTT